MKDLGCRVVLLSCPNVLLVLPAQNGPNTNARQSHIDKLKEWVSFELSLWSQQVFRFIADDGGTTTESHKILKSQNQNDSSKLKTCGPPEQNKHILSHLSHIEMALAKRTGTYITVNTVRTIDPRVSPNSYLSPIAKNNLNSMHTMDGPKMPTADFQVPCSRNSQQLDSKQALTA